MFQPSHPMGIQAQPLKVRGLFSPCTLIFLALSGAQGYLEQINSWRILCLCREKSGTNMEKVGILDTLSSCLPSPLDLSMFYGKGVESSGIQQGCWDPGHLDSLGSLGEESGV